MIIHFMKEDCLNELKANVPANIRHYSEPTNDWVYDFFGGENPFVEFKIQVDDFKFAGDTEMLEAVSSKCDVENAIRLYYAMRNLTPTQAVDERLWAGLCHGDFWEYMHLRWNGSNFRSGVVSGLLWRYFFNRKEGPRKCLVFNALSRLWWWGYLTYDPQRKDPFELIRYLGKGFAQKSVVLFSSRFIGSRNVARGLISALLELGKESFSLNTGNDDDVFTYAGQYLNILGGLHIIDYYSEEEIKEKVIRHMKSLVK